jgi:hypothetical protein
VNDQYIGNLAQLQLLADILQRFAVLAEHCIAVLELFDTGEQLHAVFDRNHKFGFWLGACSAFMLCAVLYRHRGGCTHVSKR